MEEVRYVPIIMDERFRARYPARSRVERKNRIYNCCPQLDYDAFVAAAPAERALIYLEGLRECGAGLAKLGATPAQVTEFDAVLTEVGRRIAARLGHCAARVSLRRATLLAHRRSPPPGHLSSTPARCCHDPLRRRNRHFAPTQYRRNTDVIPKADFPQNQRVNP